ncbi:macrophage mannose receptor 1-like [Diadema setosum]|uniref:macrophage mannose receptor 1-like n=1 Tax=Diadema setosum TaxID=31175 RepID=UPI003B3A126F
MVPEAARGKTNMYCAHPGIVCPGDPSSPDSCYLYRQDEQPWEVARDACDELGGYLVAIETPNELSSIREDVLISHYGITTNPRIWTGLNDRSTEGVYTWERVGGTVPLSSSMWVDGFPTPRYAPSQDYVVCPGDASSPDSCYLYRQDIKTWDVARDTCSDLGGYLVAMETENELSSIRQDVLVSHYGMATFPSIWIGLNDRSTEGVYTWERVGGTLPLSSPMWRFDQPWDVTAPQQDCVDFDGYVFRDNACGEQVGYMCEFTP